MYAPSSYNETVTAETLSSISEKSATYSHGETHEDYNVVSFNVFSSLTDSLRYIPSLHFLISST